MHQEKVTLQNGLTGELRYKKPAKHLLVICHGYKSSPAHPGIVATTRGLNQKGHTTFTFHFSGTNPLDLERQVQDIHTIAEYFASYDSITLIGGSFGALSSAMASNSPQIRGLVTVNGFFGSNKLGGQLYSTFATFQLLRRIHPKYRKIWHFFQSAFQPAQILVPTLVIHSIVDEAVLINQSKDFYTQLAGPKQFAELESANHDLTLPGNTDEVVAIIDGWLRKFATLPQR
jgi:esterase/lipase